MQYLLRHTMPGLLLACLLTSPVCAYEMLFPGKTFTASGTVQVMFTPDDDASGQIVLVIDQAQKQVLVQTYSFTSKEIAQALVRAKQRGIDVQVIADAEQMQRMEHSKVATIAADGVPVFVDSQHDSAHNKVMVIDANTPNPVVITGSFNFTHSAQHRNAENLLLFRHNRELTTAYLENWRRHREHSQPLAK